MHRAVVGGIGQAMAGANRSGLKAIGKAVCKRQREILGLGQGRGHWSGWSGTDTAVV